jgi:hypothetical protein
MEPVRVIYHHGADGWWAEHRGDLIASISLADWADVDERGAPMKLLRRRRRGKEEPPGVGRSPAQLFSA